MSEENTDEFGCVFFRYVTHWLQ